MSATQVIRAAVAARAGGRCECCGERINDFQLDHFHGRAKARQSIENTWALHWRCHASKTSNTPNAAHWVRRYLEHVKAYGYADEVAKAETRLAWLAAKWRTG